MSTKAMVFDIQKFSVHDGPGIRTIVFLKGCPLRCKWCANPESNNEDPDLLYYPNKCIGCGKCIDTCDEGAIKTVEGMVRFDRERCKQCLKCARQCFAGARKVFGKSMSVEEVLKDVEQDIIFYECSGGGLTFSGGEPLLWPNFIAELGGVMKARGVHNAIETCGYFPAKHFAATKHVIDLVLFDIKIIDDEAHKMYCGASNKTVLENFKAIVSSSMPVVVRMPIVPGINDSDSTLNATCDFLLPYKNAMKQIHLLPYHNLGVAKFDAMGRPYMLPDTEAPTAERMHEIKERFKKRGFHVKIGG
jgi:pyruvate formate lyase activating enzyme